MRVVVVGGGWAGCSAAYFASRAGAKVVMTEKTDLLLGTGLVGGIIKNNGRLTAALEAAALGIGDLFEIIDTVVRHKNIDFPGHKHAALYDVERIEPVIRKCLSSIGVDIKFKTLIKEAEVSNGNITSVSYENRDRAGAKHTEKIEGDVFIDTTGTAGPMKNCIRYGAGCAMCILRCPSFGPRTSLTELAGVREIKVGEGNHSFEAMSGSCKIDKRSLKKTLVQQLEKEGVLIIPLPEKFHKSGSLRLKACQQYAMEEFATNLIVLDTGQAKLMTPFFPIESLREIEGFREAKYADPYSGGEGNSVRFMALAPCDGTMRVQGVENLFCAGEKVGPIVGHTEAIITGALAGINAARVCRGLPLYSFPPELAVGDIIDYMHREIKYGEGLKKKYTFSGSVYFDRMVQKNLYQTDYKEVNKKVTDIGMMKMFRA